MALTCAAPTVHHAAHSLTPSFTALQGTCHHLTPMPIGLFVWGLLSPDRISMLLIAISLDRVSGLEQCRQLLAIGTWGVSQSPSTEIKCDQFIKNHHFRAMEDDHWQRTAWEVFAHWGRAIKIRQEGAFMVPVPGRVPTYFRQENPKLYRLKVWTWWRTSSRATGNGAAGWGRGGVVSGSKTSGRTEMIKHPAPLTGC